MSDNTNIYEEFANRLSNMAETLSLASDNGTLDLIDWHGVARSLVESVNTILDDEEELIEFDINDDDAPSFRD